MKNRRTAQRQLPIDRGSASLASIANKAWPTTDVRKRVIEKWNCMRVERQERMFLVDDIAVLQIIWADGKESPIASGKLKDIGVWGPLEEKDEEDYRGGMLAIYWQCASRKTAMGQLIRDATMTVSEYRTLVMHIDYSAEHRPFAALLEGMVRQGGATDYHHFQRQIVLISIIRKILSDPKSLEPAANASKPSRQVVRRQQAALRETFQKALQRGLLHLFCGRWARASALQKQERALDKRWAKIAQGRQLANSDGIEALVQNTFITIAPVNASRMGQSRARSRSCDAYLDPVRK